MTCSAEHKQRQNDIANIMILPSGANKQISSEKPSTYMEYLRKQHATSFDELLASNLIPPLEDSGLLLDEFEYFRAMRIEFLAARIRQLTEADEETKGRCESVDQAALVS